MATNDYILSRVKADSSFEEIAVPQSTLISGGFRNVLINGDFRINQRGVTSIAATSDAYFFDRWHGYAVTAGSITSAASGAGNQITIPNATSHVDQIIEGSNIVGGTYVLSWEGTAAATVNSTSVANGGTIVIAAGTQTTVSFSNGTVTKAQLELGAIATPFEQRPIGLELALCQRYYEETLVANETEYGIMGITNGLNSRTFAVQKRAAPTVKVYSSVTDVVDTVNNGNGNVQTAITGVDVYKSGFQIQLSGTTGQTYTYHFTADAEL